ncbi:hypothetical protein [Latilactobacillus sakei]|uniref:hypothetical protein n=1 Tax=Latilactobacillus sakei TaxID=1599 RepID=UPI0024DF6C63|nr:hypothetical protein [Latilactobacillus sakei]
MNDYKILGDSIASWIKWLLTLLISLAAAYGTARRYHKDHRICLKFQIKSGMLVKQNGGVTKTDGLTISVMNSGSVKVKIYYLGIGKIHSKLFLRMGKRVKDILNLRVRTMRFNNMFDFTVADEREERILEECEFVSKYKIINPIEDVSEYKFTSEELVGSIIRILNEKDLKLMKKKEYLTFCFYFRSFDGNIYRKRYVTFKGQHLYKIIEDTSEFKNANESA